MWYRVYCAKFRVKDFAIHVMIFEFKIQGLRLELRVRGSGVRLRV